MQTATSPTSQSTRASGDDWRESVDPYARPHLGRAIFSLSTSVLPFLALWTLMYLALDVSYLITLALAPLAAGFLLRTYILFHDCTHGSLLPGKRANAWVGSVLALLVFTPFAALEARARGAPRDRG